MNFVNRMKEKQREIIKRSRRKRLEKRTGKTGKKIVLNEKTVRVLDKVGIIIAVLFGTIAVLSTTGFSWMLRTWNNLTMEELIFHLKAPLEGTNTELIWDFFWSSGIYVIVVLALLIVVFYLLRKRKAAFYTIMATELMMAIAMFSVSVMDVWKVLDVSSYIESQRNYSTFIDDNYVAPSSVELVFPEKKRNLIYIFLESIECTYADEANGGAFEINVIPELTELAKEGEDFSGDSSNLNGGIPMAYATWTVAAMFGHTTGLPLKLPIDGNSMNTQESFLPGVTSLGDILNAQGYSQTLLIGSDATFGGRGLYFKQHGDFDIFDYNYAIEIQKIPEDYNVWWGYEDAKLFEYAKEELLKLSAQEEPFNLTLLTVDTHFEDGYVCELCPDFFGEDQYSNIIACASRQVTEFVRWIQQQPFYENTTIVLVGDHNTMDSDYCENVSQEYTRKVFTTYLNSPVTPETDMFRTYSTFDNFPTTLASLGVEIEGNRLGLGTNLFSAEQTLTEQLGWRREYSELVKKSRLIDSLVSDIQVEEEIE